MLTVYSFSVQSELKSTVIAIVCIHNHSNVNTYLIGFRKKSFPTVHGLGMKVHTSMVTHIFRPTLTLPPPLQLSYRVPYREPLPATDPGGTNTMVTASRRSFTQQLDTEDTAVQETNPATPGQLVLAN